MFGRGPLWSCALALWALVFVAPAFGQGTGAPPESDFAVTTLAKGADKTGEPIAMAVLPDRRVLHTSRDGRVWLTTPNATTSLAAQIPVYTHDEDGLQGIAIDPDFATNRWVYVYYAPPLNTPGGDAPGTASGPAAFDPYKGYNQLSRMKLTQAGTLDRSTEQNILQVPADRGICCHAGGEIDFDAQGNLYLSTGDDTNPFESEGYSPIDERSTRNPSFDAQRTSANTNDLRGKLLRIKVAADGSYTTPAGNLFAPGQMGTRPEIYAMGFRNPFRFAVDDETGWVYLGDYGPDAGGPNPNRGPGGQVEFNLIKEAGNYGWPYCHGKNDAYRDYDFATGASGPAFNCAAPKNTSPRNTGLVDLPPAKPAWIAYDGCSVPEFGCGSESPMGGETYHFDPANPSLTKFPAYYDDKNFAYEFGRSWLRVLTVGPDGALQRIEPFLDGFDFKQMINAQFGPDGSLYVLDYGTGFFRGDANSAVYRIDYVQGTRAPVVEVTADRTSGPAPLNVTFSSEGTRDPDGGTLTYAWDFDGDGDTDSTSANPEFNYATAGRYTASLTVTDSSGQEGSASVNIVAGNTEPTVRLITPPDGGMFEYGDTIKYQIEVTDPEDGEIDCSKVRLDTSLGHAEHSHGDQNFTGCSGQVTIPAAWEDKDQHSFYVLTASYTDATTGLTLTGSTEAVLEHKVQQAEFFDAQNGVQNVDNGGAAGGKRVGYIAPGDWIRFDDINLSGIDSVVARVTSTGTSGFDLRAGSPTGPLVARVSVPNTGGVDNYRNLPAVPITDPGGTQDLYVVFTAANQDLDELTFQGPGVTGNASPVIEASATPTTGTSPLEVDFTATATDPEGTPVSLKWNFGVAGAPEPTTGTASYTYAQRGVYTASVTATDGDGRTSVRTFRIEVQSQCGSGTETDQFTGTALDKGVWSRILREDTTGYKVENGKLVVNAAMGDMYGGNTSAENIIGRPAPGGAWTATTQVTLDHVGNYEQAGMFLHGSDQNFLKLAFIQTPQGRNIEFIRQRGGTPDDQGAADRSPTFAANSSDTVHLRLSSDGTAVTAAWSLDGTTWTPVGRSQPLDGITDPLIGISAFNGVGTPASFESFSLSGEGAGGSDPDDEFEGSALDPCRWTTILRENAAGYRVEDGALEIDAVDGDLYGTATAENVVLQDAPSGGWEAVTKVVLPQGEEYEQAGLVLYANDQDFAKLVLMDIPDVGWRVEYGLNVDGQPVFDPALDRSGALPANINTAGIYLKLTNTGSSMTAAWSADGVTWTTFGRTRSATALADPRIGLAAYNGNGQAARFDYFHLDAVDAEPTCQTGATPDAGYRMLFDGTEATLDDWKMSGPGGFSLEADCSILSFGGLGLLYHPDSFTNYSLKMDWKMAGDDNAGVFVGFKDPGNDPFNAVRQGHEVQIDATDDPSRTTGAIYGFKASDTVARDAVLNPPGEWNSYEIVVTDQRIQVFLNGVKINDYTDTDPNRMNAPSLIGLQNHGNGDDVYFRNIQIKELDQDGEPPTLALTSPQDGAVVSGSTVTVSGTTNGTRVEVSAGGSTKEVTPSGGSFTTTVPVTLGSNPITVVAYDADDRSTARAVTVVSRSYGQRIGGFTDPEGDDDGPGTYVYPTNSAFNPGAFDLLGMEVYTSGDDVRFVTKIAGDITNAFGADKISVQRINVLLGSGDGGAVPAMPGTNMDAASPWSRAVVIDGRFGLAGVYAADGSKVSGGVLSVVPQTKEIILTVPRSSLGDLDLATAKYGTAMYGNAEGGEGIGNVRPVYSLEHWNNPPEGMGWIKEYRFGGGAGEWENTDDKDTDTSDPNAMDIIVGEGQTQAEVLDWETASPTRLPMLAFAAEEDPGKPVLRAYADPVSGSAPLTVGFSADAIDPDGGRVTFKWTFENGSALGSNVSWTFRTAGTHEVTVVATDDEGETSSETLEVVVAAAENQAPVLDATADKTSGAAALKVRFNAVGADPDGDEGDLVYRWDFGDGNGTSLEAAPEHTYMEPGTYTATVTVTDPGGKSATKTVTITVTNPPGNVAPSVQAAALPQSGDAPLDVLLTANGTDPDGNSDSLTYSWQFGDGASGTGHSVRHVFTRAGVYEAVVTATDSRGATGTGRVTITVGNPRGNQAPTVMVAANPRRGVAPLRVTFGAVANDPDGDGMLYEWDFGDGGKAGGERVQHTYTKPGTYVARITVDDLKGGRATAEVTVTVTGRAAQGVLGQTESSSAVTLKTLSGRGLKMVVACATTTSTGKAKLVVSKAMARKLGLKLRTLASAKVKCVNGKRTTVYVKASKAMVRKLNAKKARKVRTFSAKLGVTLKGKAIPSRTVKIKR